MFIEIVTGVPSSGKSYYSVHRIKKLLDTSGRFLVLHNIEGLAPLDNPGSEPLPEPGERGLLNYYIYTVILFF